MPENLIKKVISQKNETGSWGLLKPLGDLVKRRAPITSLAFDSALYSSPFSDSEVTDFAAEFEELISRILSGVPITQADLLPFLCREVLQERIAVNYRLAWAYEAVGNLASASTTISRAWRLSAGAVGVFPLYKRICLAQKDTASLRSAYKRMGMAAAKRGDLDSAIEFFDLWQNAFNTFDGQDKFEYDFDILDAVDTLAAPYRFAAPGKIHSSRPGKVRVGYLLKWVCELNSNLMNISHAFAQFHDQSKFDVVFFVADLENEVALSPQGSAHIERLRKKGYRVVVNSTSYPDSLSKTKSLVSFSRQIFADNLDILVTCAGLADFAHGFLTALRPARLIVGHVQGPPPQFVHPAMDWCISWSKHPLIDSPANCSLVELKMTGKTDHEAIAYTKEEMNLPVNSCVLISGGRFTKFQHRLYWESINEILEQHSNVIYMVSGVEEMQIPFFRELVSAHVRDRVRFLGWRADFEQILGVADILVDTFPNGGGQVIVQAMARRIPVVAHRNNYLNEFCQTDWSPVEDFLLDSELVVERGDFDAFKKILGRLISDSNFRQLKGEDCKAQMVEAGPEPGVRACEEIYLKLVASLSFRAG